MKQYLILFLVLCFGLVGNPCYAQKAKPTARPRTTQVKQPVNKELSLLKGGKIVTYTFTEVHPYAMFNNVDYDDYTQNGKYTIQFNALGHETFQITFSYLADGKQKTEVTLKTNLYYLDETEASFFFSNDEDTSSKLTVSLNPKTGKEAISLFLVYNSDPALDKKLASYFGRSELCNDDEYFPNIAFTKLSNVEVKK